MDFPDSILLNQIECRNAYLDKKSLEKSTQKVKGKYKLAGNRIRDLHIYYFFVLTSEKDATNKKMRFCINKDDWEEPERGCLKKQFSYTDLSKYEILNDKDILLKIKDKENQFRKVAKLCQSKYNEFLETLIKIEKTKYAIKPNQSDIIEHAHSALVADTVKKLGLS